MHLSDEVISRALADGVLTQQQLDHLRQLSEKANDKPLVGTEGEESLKFVRSFGDVFIAIGVVLVVGGTAFTLRTESHLLKIIAGIALGFLLGEWLLRKKRLALPGIILALTTTLLLAWGALDLGDELRAGKSDHDFILWRSVALALTFAYSLAFYIRYRLPFALMTSVSCIVAFLLFLNYSEKGQLEKIAFISGVAVLCLAIWLDKHDRMRTRIASDNAFWLHVLSAPLITHGLIYLLFGSLQNTNDMASLLGFLLCFSVFCLIALFLDRRALLISSFSSMLASIGGLISQSFGGEQHFSIAALLLGVLVLALGVYWHSIRAKLFARFSDSALAQWVPPFTTKQSHSTSA
jgi:hypothetical protein